MISVIIPTMWLSDYLPAMVEKYLGSELVTEILIIDNNPEKKKTIPGVKVIYSGKNIYVNPAWNMGAGQATGEYLLIANDDIFIDNLNEVLIALVNNLGRHEIAGLDGLTGSDSLSVTANMTKQYYRDWGSFMFLRKSDYMPIPHYKIMAGDWWLWMALRPMFITGVKGKNEGSKTVNTMNYTDVMKADSDHFDKTYKPQKRILHLIMSCNRPEYLVPALNSLDNLWHSDQHIYRVLIDDYPDGRNNELFHQLARTHKVDKLILNTENKGLSVVWHMLYEMFRGQFDYVLHQEDDVILKHRITINTMIQALDGNCSVILARQPWYDHETPCKAKDDDIVLGHHRIEKREGVFSPMFSLYPAWVMDTDYKKEYGHYPNEGLIMHHLKQDTVLLKTIDGGNMIEHIGDYKTGRIILSGEPGWDLFKDYDPKKKYCSKTGKTWTEPKQDRTP